MLEINPAKYRPNVGIMLINADKQVWVGARIDFASAYWQMPQGGVDAGEDMTAAMWRELYEEIGVQQQDCKILAKTPDWIYYDVPADLGNTLWGGKYKGQKQVWYALKLTAPDTVINIATEEPEFKAWKWIPAHTLVDTAVPFKRRVYQQVLDIFKQYVS